MPKRTSSSSSEWMRNITDKARRAHEEHKGDEIVLSGGGDLPPGIDGGTAQLVDCRFGEYEKGDNKGEPFFYAAGVVKYPIEFKGDVVEGRRTTLGPEPLCDTPNAYTKKTFSHHYGWMLNELRKLGVKTDEIDVNDLEGIMKVLRESKPHFRFRTWQGAKQTEGPFKDMEPRVNHDWRGICEYDGEVSADVVDSTEEESEQEETVPFGDALDMLADRAGDDTEAGTELVEKALAAGISQDQIDNTDDWESVAILIRDAEQEASESEPSTASDDSTKLGDVGSRADGGDDTAIDLLSKLAEENSIDADSYESWYTLAVAIEGVGGSSPSEENEESGWKPVKGEVYPYTPPRMKKSRDCEVMAVFEGKKTCNLKGLSDGKSYKGVPWSKIEET